jgi:uncharacterized protein YigE (DUF2233 family)
MRGKAFLSLMFALGACVRIGGASADRGSWCHMQLFEGSRFTVCDNEGGKLQLFAAARDQDPLRSFSDVERKVDVSKVAFAMNAGMFDEHGRPIGLAIVRPGRSVHQINLRDGPGNFHMKPNGVFQVDTSGRASVLESGPMPSDVTLSPELALATQSGPILVIHGKLHPKIEPDGESRLTRNGVGVTAEGHALFVISEDPVSFGKLARFFRDGLHTPNALYFDGSVSSLWDPPDGRQDSHSRLGPIVVAFKPAASAPDRGDRARP